jgi:transposase
VPSRRPPASRWSWLTWGPGLHSGEQPAEKAEKKHGISLDEVKHPEAGHGFVLLPRRWVVERDFAWASRFRRLVKDYERLPETVAGLHFVAFACLFVHRVIAVIGPSP